VSIDDLVCESWLKAAFLDLSLGCNINSSGGLEDTNSWHNHSGKFWPLGIASIDMFAFKISLPDIASPPSTIDTDADTY
jgi:hypothetical protein